MFVGIPDSFVHFLLFVWSIFNRRCQWNINWHRLGIIIFFLLKMPYVKCSFGVERVAHITCIKADTRQICNIEKEDQKSIITVVINGDKRVDRYTYIYLNNLKKLLMCCIFHSFETDIGNANFSFRWTTNALIMLGLKRHNRGLFGIWIHLPTLKDLKSISWLIDWLVTD